MGLKELLVAVLVALAAIGWFSVKGLREANENLREELGTARLQLIAQEQTAAATEAAFTNLSVARTRASKVNQELALATPTLVPDGIPLPAGWRVLHDAAAAGVPPTAGSPAAAPVDAQEAAGTVRDNYAACREQDEHYQELQRWLVNSRLPR